MNAIKIYKGRQRNDEHRIQEDSYSGRGMEKTLEKENIWLVMNLKNSGICMYYSDFIRRTSLKD